MKIKKQVIYTYIAEDGKEFDSQADCVLHEKELAHEKSIEEAEKLRIKELDGLIPLSNDGLMNECSIFRWYKLKSGEDFDILEKAYGSIFGEPEQYPDIVCIETVGYELYEDDSYSYNMETCKEVTERYWKKLGYEVTFKRLFEIEI